MASKLCYNRGCGKQYNPRENLEEGCQFHPGAPFFHEGFKGWTCCDKKVSSLKTYNILWFCYTYSLTRDLIYLHLYYKGRCVSVNTRMYKCN